MDPMEPGGCLKKPCYPDSGKKGQAFFADRPSSIFTLLFLPDFCLDLFPLSYVPPFHPYSVFVLPKST